MFGSEFHQNLIFFSFKLIILVFLDCIWIFLVWIVLIPRYQNTILIILMIILAKNTLKNNHYHNSKYPPVVAGALYERVTGSQISLYAEPFPLYHGSKLVNFSTWNLYNCVSHVSARVGLLCFVLRLHNLPHCCPAWLHFSSFHMSIQSKTQFLLFTCRTNCWARISRQ